MSNPKYENIGSPEVRVMEECAELIQAITKSIRFGWFSSHPDRPRQTNIDEVRYEIEDVIKSMDALYRQLSVIQKRQDSFVANVKKIDFQNTTIMQGGNSHGHNHPRNQHRRCRKRSHYSPDQREAGC